MAKKIVISIPDDLDIETLGGNFALIMKKNGVVYEVDKTISEKNIGRMRLDPEKKSEGNPAIRDNEQEIIDEYKKAKDATPAEGTEKP